MKKLMNWRVFSLVLWIIVTVTIVLTMPNMNQLVRDKGQITIPNSAESMKAKKMLESIGEDGKVSSKIITVFSSGSDDALNEKQMKHIDKTIEKIKQQKQELFIKKMVTHLDNKETKKQLISKDRTTVLLQIDYDRTKEDEHVIAEKLDKLVKNDDMKTYITSNQLIMDDFVNSTEDGIKKTEIIAVIFIIGVLIIVFRSPIIPLISLTVVSISYLAGLGIVGHLVESYNFPFSNFTQVFLVVILFGIGTDYNILLFTRFKEELLRHDTTLLAVKATYKTAGKTVIYSALAVFVGFSALGFAQFGLYQASSAVAVGIVILLIALLTLNPFFMVLLGKKMFWPVKSLTSHSDSKIWRVLAKFSVMRPLIVILMIGVLTLPFVLSYSNILSYDDLQEVNDHYSSKQGVRAIEKHYPAGLSSPVTIAIESNKRMDNAMALQKLDDFASQLNKEDGISQLYSVTRPESKKIKDLYISNQSGTLHDGIGEANSGIKEIHHGLSNAEKKMQGSNPSDLKNVQKLIDGTSALQNGVDVLGTSVQSLATGIQSGASGAKELAQGIATVERQMGTVQTSLNALQTAYAKFGQNFASFGQSFKLAEQSIVQTTSNVEQITQAMDALIVEKPELANNAHVQKTKRISNESKAQLTKISQQLRAAMEQYDATVKAFNATNGSLKKISDGQGQLVTGIGRLKNGMNELESNLQKAANGSQQLATKTPTLSNGLQAMKTGQQQLKTGLDEASNQLGLLKNGLVKSTNGLHEVQNGLGDAERYTEKLSNTKAAEKLYVPQDVINSKSFQRSVNMYMSDDRKMAQFNIILDVNPYSKEAMDIVGNVKKRVQAYVDSGELGDVKVAVGGKTSENIDLKKIATNDFTRTAIIMLIGIGLVLLPITRSLFKTLVILSSLSLAYYTAIGMSEWISQKLFDVTSLAWNVPFFSFIMIIALGVDYSIFLMMRHRELDGNGAETIVEATKHIGGVVITATFILGGTFAALIPSGVLTLIEVALTVIIGLLLICFVMLPIFVPALIGLYHKLGLLFKKK